MEYSIIDEIRYFQRYELHEEALEMANKVMIESLEPMERVTLYKLMTLSYRKLRCFDYALQYICKAIKIVENEIELKEDKRLDKELAICLMNKGVIYDAQQNYNEACLIYRKAISIFRSLNDLDSGILLNALINYGDALCNLRLQSKAVFIFREALNLVEKEDDIRYTYLNKKLDDLTRR